ncbi:hypothetical protein ECKD2_18661 [Escherichia coli KD2]|nr:hypothetical protein ECKD2_18661 [Escherichia coli KD2]ESD80424.1 hypothetical protein HMPREF1611_04103 [Escherichia coli 908573]
MESQLITLMLSVYPRWRGEHNTDYKNYVLADGLSPLARGTLSFSI